MKSLFFSTATAFLSFAIGNISNASDHLDAPMVFKDGRLDVNDSYIFQSPEDPDKTIMIMTVNLAAGIMSPNTFNTAAVYELNIDNTGDAIADVTYSFRFGKPRGSNSTLQRLTVRRNGALIARGLTGRDVPIQTASGGRVRCDLFDDPFFFDFVGFENGFSFTGDDFFAGLNVSAIVIEVPSADLSNGKNQDVSLCARTTINGIQFDRVGRPAINTALIPKEMKNAFNSGFPANDFEDFGNIVQTSIEGLNGGDTATAATLTSILLPDVLPSNLADPSGFLNGRGLTDDVIDAELNLLSNGDVTGDMVDSNDVSFKNRFPFLADAHQ